MIVVWACLWQKGGTPQKKALLYALKWPYGHPFLMRLTVQMRSHHRDVCYGTATLVWRVYGCDDEATNMREQCHNNKIRYWRLVTCKWQNDERNVENVVRTSKCTDMCARVTAWSRQEVMWRDSDEWGVHAEPGMVCYPQCKRWCDVTPTNGAYMLSLV